MTKYDYYWASKDEWCYFTADGVLKVRADAPKEAQESYRHYLEQKKRREERYNKFYKIHTAE